MSKYILEINPDYEGSFKGVMILGAKEDNLFVDTIAVENLEQYTPVDVEDVYCKAHSDGYNKGLKDGKADRKKGCDGCRYEHYKAEICQTCMNNYVNHWESAKQDDKIEVGDEVNWLGTCFIVTRIFQPYNMKEQCDGIDDDGCVYNYVLIDDLEKTGRHFDISSILEAMKK